MQPGLRIHPAGPAECAGFVGSISRCTTALRARLPAPESAAALAGGGNAFGEGRAASSCAGQEGGAGAAWRCFVQSSFRAYLLPLRCPPAASRRVTVMAAAAAGWSAPPSSIRPSAAATAPAQPGRTTTAAASPCSSPRSSMRTLTCRWFVCNGVDNNAVDDAFLPLAQTVRVHSDDDSDDVSNRTVAKRKGRSGRERTQTQDAPHSQRAGKKHGS